MCRYETSHSLFLKTLLTTYMFDYATALCDILYKRLRNTLSYLLTYLLTSGRQWHVCERRILPVSTVWRPTADWRCLANGRVAAQACVCRLWAVAWVVRRLRLVTRERIRGGWSTRCAIQMDVLPFFLPYLPVSTNDV